MGIATTAAIITAVGAGVSAVGELQESRQQAEALEHNANIANQDARLVEARGEEELRKARRDRRRLLARQVAIAAASGRDIGGGTPLDIINRSQQELVIDENIIQFNTRTAASALRERAVQDFNLSKQVRTSGRVRAASGFLLGLGQSFAGGGFGKISGAQQQTHTASVNRFGQRSFGGRGGGGLPE